MKALQLVHIGELAEVELPVPAPGVGELQIKTAAATICTSDLNDIARNPFGIKLPRVLGHEGAGVVAAIGSGVSGFAVGDRVAAHPVIPCGQCESCRRGLGHLCDHMGHLGLDRDGTFAEHFCLPASRARLIPEGVDGAVAALVEPVSVCLEAVRRARVSAGETVLVLGDGPFGIMISRLALLAGPARLILVGRHDFRLRQVPEAIRINERQSMDAARAVLAAAAGSPSGPRGGSSGSQRGGVDAAVLAAGSPAGVALCLRCLRPRGRLVIFSGLEAPAPVDLFRLHVKELEILGACNDEGYLDEAVGLLADPRLALDTLITHRLPFAEWRRAFALASGGKDEALKVAMTFGEAA
jgi:threonine dehydrogenase-like Zn-dependent dehydrogenase